MAAALSAYDADVPARGGGAHRRDAARARRLWPACGACELALRDAYPVRRRRLRLHAAAEQAAFGQRRKMLRQALKDFSALRGMSAGALLEAAGITPTARAEEIAIEGFVALARAAVGES
jgi:hypothetical protein